MKRAAQIAVDDAPESLNAPDLLALRDLPRLGVAVSGGGDSIALLHMLIEMRGPAGMLGLTVDHGLRPESAYEARWVASLCAELGVAHRTLRAPPLKSQQGNLSSNARDVRYALMGAACHEEGIQILLTGHTKDDVAETLLMRLARGSGVTGLAAISGTSARDDGLTIHRPLLNVSRQELRDWLTARGLEWLEDPTNFNEQYERPKARRLLAELGSLGLRADRLVRTARQMRAADEVLEAAADQLATEAVTYEPIGLARLNFERFSAVPLETRWRLMARILCQISGGAYRPRFTALEALLNALPQARALHGCLIAPHRGAICITREPAACSPRAVCGGQTIWDRRYVVRASAGALDGVEIGALGEGGLAQLRAHGPLPPALADAPLSARLSHPALWRGAALAGCPRLDIHLDPVSKGYEITALPRNLCPNSHCGFQAS